jgi:hypothetical protein
MVSSRKITLSLFSECIESPTFNENKIRRWKIKYYQIITEITKKSIKLNLSRTKLISIKEGLTTKRQKKSLIFCFLFKKSK